jgi:hypothetical protein
MQTVQVARNAGGFARTTRVDYWWLAPASTAIGLIIFFGYLTFRAFNATYVWFESVHQPHGGAPFFTPVSGYPGSVPLDHAWFGNVSLVVAAVSSAVTGILRAGARHCFPSHLLLLPRRVLQGGVHEATELRGGRVTFRLSRRTRAAPVSESAPLHALWRSLPHRLPVVGGPGAFFKQGHFGIGVGTVVMVMNAALLTGYTFGCHSWRHLIGGQLDCFTCEQRSVASIRHVEGSTWLNERHMAFAWFCLVWVAFTDFYIYLVSSGTIRDLNTWGA